ncbi:phosphate/phosphite/phosphonate ABC transporter substrate-binding protein [Sulfurimonas sp. MAG313]|nr:phosphate/phosphite/phosphonate ABC transporter substrate-binding protein [Sulfurimonas sp. MAG313]MDF1879991.1 phosphate/phosphite/phosphonate ABC transporter substrate-binding protein [Sulfurimonas sp. MAG313]
MRKIWILFILFTSILHSQEIILAVVPQQSSLKLIKTWQPIAQYLFEETGTKVVYKTDKSIEKFEANLYKGKYDLVYVNPYQYVVLHKKLNYKAKIRAKKNIIGIIVSKRNENIKDILKDDPLFLFPSANAFAATRLIKYELMKNFNYRFNTTKKIRYVNSHDSVYKAVARGLGDLGGGIERTFNALSDKQSKSKLHISYKTKAYPSHPFAFRPDMDKKLQSALIQAIIDMPKDLKDRLKINKFIRVKDDEYTSIYSLAKEMMVK